MKALQATKSVYLIWVVCLILGGCRQPVEISPDVPGTRPVSNPDFIAGSVWENVDASGPFREFRIQPGRNVVAVVNSGRTLFGHRIPDLIDGTHTLRLTAPKADQKLMSGYPATISYPAAVLFTDNPTNPSVAQIALLVPGAGNYFVLLGSYIKGLDTMEWDMLVPVTSKNITTLESAPASLFKGELIFRRK